MFNLNIIIFYSCIVLLPRVSYSQTITFAVDDYCPYYCKDNDSETGKFEKNPGFIIEILDYAFKKVNIQTNYVFVPWERGISEVTKNKVNGIVITSKENAPELIFPEQEQGYSVGCFVTQNTNDWRFIDKTSLYGIRLGVIQNYDYGEPVDSYIWQHHQPENQVAFVAGANALPRLLQMLVKKRIDATIDDENVLRQSIKKLNLETKVIYANCTKDQVKLYVAFSPKDPDSVKYANILSNAMISLRESAQLATILAKYDINDWK